MAIKSVVVEIFRATTQAGETWHLFRDTRGEFFQADGGSPWGTTPEGEPRIGTDPYFYSAETTRAERDGLNSMLLRDALFAAKAVPVVLEALGHTENLLVHAHDWTFSALALTIKDELVCEDSRLRSAVVLLTFHNPFDHWLARHLRRLVAGHVEPGDRPVDSPALAFPVRGAA